MQAGRAPPLSPVVFGERMRERVASGALAFTAKADQDFVVDQYDAGFIAAIDRVAAQEDEGYRCLNFRDQGWADAEAAQVVEALQYAATRCAFPHGAVAVAIRHGNHLSEEMGAKFEMEGKFEMF